MNLIPRLEFLMQALLRRDRRCPHCGSRRTEVIARKYAVVRVRRCDECLLCFTDPIYRRSIFGPLYDRIYGAEGTTTEVPATDELEQRLRESFRGTDKDCHDRLQRIAAIAPGKRLLEIGSSWGYFLHQAGRHDFDPTGVEISGPRREFGTKHLGVRIVPSFEALGAERFDVVYTAHTLEHFTDLEGVLPALFERLSPGGILVLEVPHFDLAGLGGEALSAVGAVHPLGFTPEFFRRNLPKAGFRIRGFFDAWRDFPEREVERSSADVVLLLAERPIEEERKAA